MRAAPPLLTLVGSAVASTRWPQEADSYAPVTTSQRCPYAGQDFPPPTNPAAAPAILAAQSALRRQLDAELQSGGAGGLVQLNGTFFSVAVFSAADGDDAPFFDYHYAVPGMSNATGGRPLDNDSVYRIGSVTKMLTVYALLAARGDADFGTPVTEFLSDLFDGVDGGESELERIQWEDITVGALASQIAGLPRDYGWPDYTTQANGSQLPLLGVNSSKLPSEDIPACGLPAPGFSPDLPLCSREEFIRGLNQLGPYFPPFETPTYSNAGFRLLGHAMEKMTGEPFEETFNRQIADALGLSATTVTTPTNDSHGVIPGGKTTAWWGLDLGGENPAGSIYSTAADLTLIGRSILRSTLLRPSLTRRWLKPHSRTSDDTHAVGAPWEISYTRIPLTSTNDSSTTDAGAIRADLYTKTGNVGAYSASVVLDPARGWGAAVLGAGAASGAPVFCLADVAARAFVRGFEAAAREEAGRAYGGVYVQQQAGGNGTLRLEVVEGQPGLVVREWVANGVDVLGALTAANLVGAVGGTGVTLYPARMEAAAGDGEGVVVRAFRAVIEALPNADFGGPVESACLSWLTANPAQVANRMLDDVWVGVDAETGEAAWVEMRAWRERYVRK
ncbi:beta-lactamase-like 1 [Diplodia corticola]|uniref:Beta-lactamase-like 1 n=1 Tax=Diplodia corticola TaxID=236234 RepID=A0A1J9QP93_9PEZI|nr:beta-lactamase-like 1 [Diplodia corticola]OJD30272.1 beta-lactamase-like 1 [Diplodia corticola]